jgi:hypothetical protein
MTAAQQADDDLVHDLILPDDHLRHLTPQPVEADTDVVEG